MNDRDQIIKLRNFNREQGFKSPVFMSGYADASYKNDRPHKGGGWGIWVRDDRLRVLRSGVCPDWVLSSSTAEACAVWAAIYTALTHLNTSKCNILVVKTDCQGVADHYRSTQGRGLPKDEGTLRGVKRAFEMAHSFEIKLIVKWVKGHQQELFGNTPGYLNHRVDQLAWDARVGRESFKKVFVINEDVR